jgi:ribonuclease VapC
VSVVLDASALLALLQREPGAEAVAAVLDGAAVSTVNWSEVLQKLMRRGIAPGSPTVAALRALGLRIEPFTVDDAQRTAELWERCRRTGLSTADRACLALAHRLDAEALTTDRAWAGVDAGVPVRLVR